jgi:gamma-glutamyltranspeptidase / glutathione hydrolase
MSLSLSGRGVIAAGDSQTAGAGAEVLRAGGNAVDGVVAAAFAAFFSELPLASPAGAGAILWGRGGQVKLLDFFTAMPGLGLPQIEPEGLDFFPVCVDFGPTTQDFQVGRGAASVPMALDGLLAAHERGGKLPLTEVLAPAIELGRRGAVVSASVAWIFRLLRPIMMHTPGIQELVCVDGELAGAGQMIRNPALADVLEALGGPGRRDVLASIREGVLTEFGPAHGGLLTRADLDQELLTLRAPLQVQIGDSTVYTNPPPSSGGALIALGLRLAERMALGDADFLGVKHMCGLANVLGGVSRARAHGLSAVLSDPTLLVDFLGHPERWLAKESMSGSENILGSTTHISVLDSFGGAASMTMSNGEGCGHVLPGFGIHMNNFLGEEDINPGGFHTLSPGARMTTMMAPTIVTKGDKPTLVLGSGGSNRIRSVILEVLINRLILGKGLMESVVAPRCHVEGSHLWFEKQGLDGATEEALREQWAECAMFERASMYFGGVHSVGIEGDQYVGVGDTRRNGHAIVVD